VKLKERFGSIFVENMLGMMKLLEGFGRKPLARRDMRIRLQMHPVSGDKVFNDQMLVVQP
jgi:dTDP-D-glucose 4,6-dehydratase